MKFSVNSILKKYVLMEFFLSAQKYIVTEHTFGLVENF